MLFDQLNFFAVALGYAVSPVSESVENVEQIFYRFSSYGSYCKRGSAIAERPARHCRGKWPTGHVLSSSTTATGLPCR